MKKLRNNFTIVLNEYITDENMDCYDFRILCYLSKLADVNGQCFPSCKNISHVLSISRTKVKDSIKKLSDLNYITIQKRKKSQGSNASNLYTILWINRKSRFFKNYEKPL